MMTYWVMIALPFVGSLWPVNRSTLSRVFLWAGLTVFTLAIVGLRDKVGGDWVNYLEAYLRISEEGLGPALRNRSIGYGFINWVSSVMGTGIYGVNVACAGLFLFGLLKFCLHQPLPCLAWLVATPYLIVVVAMGYTAQSVALGFVMLTYVSFLDRRYWLAFLTFIIAVLFHKSAMFTVVFFVGAFAFGKDHISRIKSTLKRNTLQKNWALLGGIIILILLGLQQGPGLYSTLGHYLFREQWHSAGGTIRVLMNAVPAVLFLFAGRQIVSDDRDYQFWRMVCIVALACIPLLFFNSTLADRLSIFLVPIQLFVFSRLPLLFDDRVLRKGTVLSIGVGYGAVQWVWLTYANHAYEWIPYQNILLR